MKLFCFGGLSGRGYVLSFYFAWVNLAGVGRCFRVRMLSTCFYNYSLIIFSLKK